MMLRCVSRVLASGLAALLALGSSAHANEGAGAAGSDGVGRLVCAAPGGRARVEDGSGWVAGAADTVVTAAHIFFPAGETIDPRSCIFRLYGADGTVRAAARVRYMRSPWTDRRMRGDSAQDVAVLKLDHPLAVTPVAAHPRGLGAQAVRLLSFPAGGGDGPSAASGEAHAFPLGPVHDAVAGLRVSEPGRLFASSVASAPGSSGGLYVARGGMVVGVHVGRMCSGGECFGFGVRFDAALMAMVAAVAADQAPPPLRLASR
ncbi:MAG: serine protease [Rhizorhabdus sp.]|nr:MAG: serine protease [Rhizorhabdus sp.]